jgi:protein gp37
MAARLEAMPVEKYSGLTRRSGGRSVWTGKIRLDEKALDTPRSWKRPKRIFVNSMSDLFHEDVTEAFIGRVWRVMKETPHHTYQILTKRPERMAAITEGHPVLKNVWLGTSVENADYLDRIDHLRRVRATVRFVSFEPLIGSVAGANLRSIHWAIVGGESGPRARPMLEQWVDEIEAACRQYQAAFFFKQWGGKNKKASGETSIAIWADPRRCWTLSATGSSNNPPSRAATLTVRNPVPAKASMYINRGNLSVSAVVNALR